MFERPHHQAIAQILQALDAHLLQTNHCLFGGGTAIVLRHGEYRESVDLDFIVSNLEGYRNLRQALSKNGIKAILQDPGNITQLRDIRADQYGIRTMLGLSGSTIKFEIIHEGRIALSPPGPGDYICGIATLTPTDMAASKLLANSDRWADAGVFSRDIIDLAMLSLPTKQLQSAVSKAELAYGASILNDLAKALDNLQTRDGWLDRCMKAMAVNIPKALLWEKLRAIRKSVL